MPTCAVDRLRVEYQLNPLGIDVVRPRLSWEMVADGRNRRQTGYRVIVGSSAEQVASGEGDLWDSGEVEGDFASHVTYEGSPLRSRQAVWWRVQIRDESGNRSEWSETASWEMGLLRPTDWKGFWVGLPGHAADQSILEAAELDALLPAIQVRGSFEASGEVVRARLYCTAHGVYVPYLNGARIGDQVLAPGWTDYRIRTQYQTFDVTEQVRAGANVLGVEVGTGWYAGHVGWNQLSRTYGPVPQALMQLHLEYADGREETIASNRDWIAGTGAIRYSDFIMGEFYDARLATDWSSPDADVSDWQRVQWSALNAEALVADCSPPVRALDELVPVAITEPTPGAFVFDLGQNIAGWARLKVKGESGTQVKLRFAEILNPDGTLYITNLRSARATDTYVLAGTGEDEVYEPSFTWHGFRYVEVTSYPGTPDVSAITGRFVGSDTAVAGTFACSDSMVNQLQSNIVWGQRGNFLSVPTDCPQRDERLGWLGDAQVFIGTAVGNMDVATFFTKWMRDVVDGQLTNGAFPDVAPRAVDLAAGAPAWADCGVIVPWTVWKTYGDTGIIDEHWAAMERWMTWLDQDNPESLWQHDRGNDFGDWLSIEANTPKELIGTAYWAYDARLMAEMAGAIGREQDAERYREVFERVAAAFRAAYVREDGSIHGDTQTAYCLALHFGLLLPEQRQRAIELLLADIDSKGGHLSTGFVGVSYLCHVLTANGHADAAYRLLHQETFPSWKYSILHGATTIWERWDGWTEHKGFQDPGMNSFNHYSLGSVGEWLRRSVAGIDQVPGTAGHQQLRLAPVTDASLDWAEGSLATMQGDVRSRWERTDGGITYRFTVPANASAEVEVLASSQDRVTLDAAPLVESQEVSVVASPAGTVRVLVGSGDWEFAVAE